MTFYKNCLGGELYFQTIGETPLAKEMPAEMKNCILHASLKNEKLVLLGSDMVSEIGLIKGNSVILQLECDSKKQLKEYYEKLSASGEKTHPLEKTFRDAFIGGLRDQYGNHWLLHYKNKK